MIDFTKQFYSVVEMSSVAGQWSDNFNPFRSCLMSQATTWSNARSETWNQRQYAISGWRMCTDNEWIQTPTPEFRAEMTWFCHQGLQLGLCEQLTYIPLPWGANVAMHLRKLNDFHQSDVIFRWSPPALPWTIRPSYSKILELPGRHLLAFISLYLCGIDEVWRAFFVRNTIEIPSPNDRLSCVEFADTWFERLIPFPFQVHRLRRIQWDPIYHQRETTNTWKPSPEFGTYVPMIYIFSNSNST